MLRPTSRHPPETPTAAESPAQAALGALPTPHRGSPAAVARPLAAGDEPARILKARQGKAILLEKGPAGAPTLRPPELRANRGQLGRA